VTCEIVVVDSGSSDGSIEFLKPLSTHDSITIIPLKSNQGFARSSNIGIKASTGNYIFLLNPDTEIFKNTLSQLVCYLDNNPTVGIVGPQVLSSDGRIQHVKRRFPSLISELVLYSRLFKFLHIASVHQHSYMTDFLDDAIMQVDWIKGCAMLIRRKLFDIIGYFDEQFFMYYEEVDFCKRSVKAGWEVHYFGSTKIIHHKGKSSNQIQKLAERWQRESRYLYFRKYHSLCSAFVIWLLS
jgi:hypothetical protein